MNNDDWMSYCGDMVDRLDRDRLMCAMLAPPDRRVSLLALLAFNLEIATIPELVSEPMLGHIRLQWWRQTLAAMYAGIDGDHPVARGIADGIEKHGLPQALFDEYLDARAFDLSGDVPATLGALERYADATAGALNELMGEILGLATAPPEKQPVVRAALRDAGVAWALSGILDAVAFHSRRGRSYLPGDLQQGEAAIAIAKSARHHIMRARAARNSLPRSLLPVMMTVYLAEQRLRRLEKSGFDPSRPPGKRPGVGRLFRFYGKVLSRSY